MNSETKHLRIYLLTMIVFLLLSSIGCKKDDKDEFVLGSGTVADIDGNVYPTVIIGDQVWMAENLKTTRYFDGTPIEYPGKNNIAWEKNLTGAYSWYNNNEADYRDTYGALYNWHAVSSGKLCPAGWRVPSDEEWTKVNMYLVGDLRAGLKESSTEHLEEIFTVNLNGNGFSAMPGGVRFSTMPGGSRVTDNGYFYYIGKTGRWWSSTESSSRSAWYRSIYVNSNNVYRSHNYKETGFSVRCIRN